MSNSESDSKPQETAVASAASSAPVKAKQPNVIWRFFKWMWRVIDGKLFPGPIGRTVVAAILLAIGVAGNEGYQFIRDRIIDPDEVVKQLAKDQKTAFSKLDRELAELHGSVDENGKKALSSIEGTLAELKKANALLVSRLRQTGGRGADVPMTDTSAAASSPAGIYLGDLVEVRESGSKASTNAMSLSG